MFNYSSIINPPRIKYGKNPNSAAQARFGQQIRDILLWEFPILPGAVFTYMQMASGREWRISGPASRVQEALDFYQSSVCLNRNGTIDTGFEAMVRRFALDYITVGKYAWSDFRGFFEYIDPTQLSWIPVENKWQYIEYMDTEWIPAEFLYSEKAISLGATGGYISPLYYVLPSAVLSWLIREHDSATADGRKIRDIFIVASKELQESLIAAINTSLALHSGEVDVKKHGVPIAYIEKSIELATGQIDVSKMITRLGLANIPENFNRTDFQFLYVNEIAAALGLSLRHFWNSERATNRALEEVQEARQQVKGPSDFVRGLQRNINKSGANKRFGDKVRLWFDEEVDAQSMKIRAEVLKLRAEAAGLFMQQFAASGAQIDPQQFLAWQQADGFLPLEMTISETQNKTPVLQEEDKPLPINGTKIVDSDPADMEKSLGYDEITLDFNGRVIDRRVRVFSIEKAIYGDIVSSPTTYQEVVKSAMPLDFQDFVQKWQQEDVEYFEQNREDILEAFPEAGKEFDLADNLVIGTLVSMYKELKGGENEV